MRATVGGNRHTVIVDASVPWHGTAYNVDKAVMEDSMGSIDHID